MPTGTTRKPLVSPPAAGKLLELEGLRGLAALMVVFQHCVLTYWPSANTGWAHESRGGFDLALFNSPAAFFYNGSFAVYVFFALSGYVLSASFFRRADPGIIHALAAKRYPRLAIPVLASVLLTVAIAAADGFDAPGSTLSWFVKTPYTGGDLSLGGALREGLWDTFLLGADKYNYVIWTMRLEFLGSLLVFCNCLMLQGLRYRRTLLAIEALALVYVLGGGGLFYALFLFGMIVALSPRPAIGGLAAAAMLAMVVILGGHHETSRFHAPLNLLALPYAFGRLDAPDVSWALGAALALLLALGATSLRPLLTGAVPRWLGKISFSLYLTHSVVLATIGVRAFEAARPVLGYGGAALAGMLATLAISLALASAFEDLVDRPAIALSNRLADNILRRPRAASGSGRLARAGAP